MKVLFRQGHRLCVAKQTLVESWVVATTDDIYPAWEKLVLSNKVLGKTAYDARLVAAMQVHNISRILTFDADDFKRYAGIQVLQADEVLAQKP